jgi:putative ABC transport system substrate-binding protein
MSKEFSRTCLTVVIPASGRKKPKWSEKSSTERATVQDASRALGASVMILNASSPSEIESAFEALVDQRAGALVVSGETFFLTQRSRLVELAAHHAVPTIYAYREFPVAGGLMSYGGDYTEPTLPRRDHSTPIG